MPHEKPLRVTILYPDPRILGGVAIFIEAMRRSLDSSVQTHHFMVGRRATNRGHLSILLNTLGDALKLVWHLITMRPDVVHINPSLTMKSVLRDGLFLLVMRIMGKREVFMFMHGWEENLSARIAANPFWRALFRFIYGWPRMTVVLASRFRDQMIAMGFRAEKVVVDSAMFDGAMFAKLVRRPHQSQRLVFVSRLVPGKGVWELLDAFVLLKQRYPDLSLYFVGDGSEREALVSAVAQQKIQDVTICGYVSTEEKAQILLDSDLFVFPTSYDEGCPASLLEAMAAGLPCVTTRVGGIPDVFIDKENGVLLEEVSPHAIAAAVAGLLDDPARMAAISETNRNVGWHKYEAHSVSARIVCRYRSVLGATAI
jgi:glycosyltransferase involved in cell wall biosynthesis